MSVTRSPWEVAADIIDPLPNPYLHDPIGWIRDVLGEETWSLQQAVGESVAHNRRTTVQAGHGVGKTWLAARLVAWWVSVHPVGQAKVITTAPTDEQVKTVLWQELQQAHDAGGLDGRITLDAKWHMGASGQILVAFGRKPADYKPTSMQGHHAKYLLAILDEACGVPFALWDALGSLTSNRNGRMLAIGNPTDPSSHFAKVCAPGSGWNRIKISVLDTPVFTGEPVSENMLENLTDQTWVDERKTEYGVDAPLYTARVLGEFPDISDDTLIHPRWIREAQERSLERTRRPHLGVDVARFGHDETVIMQREGGWVRLVWQHHKLDTMKTVGHVIRVMREVNDEPGLNDFVTAAIDADGVGGGVYDRLVEQEYPVSPIHSGQAAVDPASFINKRSEWYWNLRKRFESGDIDIDPHDDKLAAQLGAIKWDMDSKGRIKVESKDDMKKRGLPSPDRADALVYAFAQSDSVAFKAEELLVPTPAGEIDFLTEPM